MGWALLLHGWQRPLLLLLFWLGPALPRLWGPALRGRSRGERALVAASLGTCGLLVARLLVEAGAQRLWKPPAKTLGELTCFQVLAPPSVAEPHVRQALTGLSMAFAPVCARTAEDINGTVGSRHGHLCPDSCGPLPGCYEQEAHQVYGHEEYTEDTPLCGAAFHAGVLKVDKGGFVSVVLTGGQRTYHGQRLHGIRSASHEGTGRGFRVEPVQLG